MELVYIIRKNFFCF